MTDLLERVKKLVALAASDSRGEASNAAIKACELIRKHELVLSEKKASSFGGAYVGSNPPKKESYGYDGHPYEPHKGTYSNYPSGGNPFDDVEDLLRRAQEAMRDADVRAKADRRAREARAGEERTRRSYDPCYERESGHRFEFVVVRIHGDLFKNLNISITSTHGLSATDATRIRDAWCRMLDLFPSTDRHRPLTNDLLHALAKKLQHELDPTARNLRVTYEEVPERPRGPYASNPWPWPLPDDPWPEDDFGSKPPKKSSEG